MVTGTKYYNRLMNLCKLTYEVRHWNL